MKVRLGGENNSFRENPHKCYCSLKCISVEIPSMFVLRLSISRGEIKELDLIASITPSAVYEIRSFL